MLQNLAQGAAYDRERQLFSLTDESAVINPRSIAQSFLYGYAGGVLLGGVTGGADLALRRVRSGEARAALKSEVTRQAEAAGASGGRDKGPGRHAAHVLHRALRH